MYELKDLYNSLNHSQRKLFLTNLNTIGIFDILEVENIERKSLEQKFELFNDFIVELLNPVKFSDYYLQQIFIPRNIIKHEVPKKILLMDSILDDFINVVFTTFVLKRDIKKMIKKGTEFNMNYEGDITKHFDLTDNPIINFYLIEFEMSLLIEMVSFYKHGSHDVIERFNKDQTELFFASLKNILMNYNKITTNIIKDFESLKEKTNPEVLKEKEVEMNKSLKEQKIELSKKFKTEKERIEKEYEALIQKEKINIEKLNKEVEKLNKNIDDKNNQLVKYKREESSYKKEIQQYQDKLKNLENKLNQNELNTQNEIINQLQLELDVYKNKENNTPKEIKFDEWLHFTVQNVLNDSGYFNQSELFTAKMILQQFSEKGIANEVDTKELSIKPVNETDDSKSVIEEVVIPKEIPSNKFIAVELDEKCYPIYNKERIYGIPHSLFIQENQVIKINEKNEFVEIFNAVLPDGFEMNYKQRILVYRDNYFYDADGNRVEVKNIPKNIYFKYKQPIVVDENDVFLMYLKKNHFNLDIIKHISDVRGNDLFVNLQIIENQIYCIDLKDSKEKLISVKNIEKYNDMSKYATFLVVDGYIMKVFSTPLFYKLSSFYTNKELMTVEIIDGEYYARNLNKEFVKLKMDYTHYTLSNGDVVWVDKQDNNFLYQEESANKLDKIKEFSQDSLSKTTVSYKESRKMMKQLPDIKDSILIIGNPSNQNAYKLGFRKYGINAKTIDGYANFNEIKKELKYYNHIVFLPNHASHDNQFKIKNEDVKVYYPKKDGVNYLYEYVFNGLDQS